jgi:HAMP domain-containing protein
VTTPERESPGPAEQVARLYEQAETEAAKASERLVGSGGFVSLLGQFAENAAALSKLSSDGMDLVLRNLRIASRRDIVRLSRQLGRTEDKLERLLQELEAVRDELAHGEPQRPPPRPPARTSRSGRGNGAAAKEPKASS